MAAIGTDPNGHRRILFVAGDGKRKTIRLGKATAKQAEAFKVKIEALCAASITGSLDDETARWMAGLDDRAHSRMAAVGLVRPRESTNAALGPFIDGFIARSTGRKANTLENMRQVGRWLVDFFKTGTDMRTIAPAQAEDWRVFMEQGGLGDNTIRRHIGRARQLWKAAIRRGVVRGANPFEGMAATVRANKKRQFFVTRAVAQKVIEACPDTEWKLLFALSR